MMRNEALSFTVYNIFDMIDSSSDFPSLINACKLHGINSMKLWYVHNILSTKMGVKDLNDLPDLKMVAEEFKKYVPNYVLYIAFRDTDCLSDKENGKWVSYKDLLVEAREMINAMVHAERSRLYFFNPKKHIRSAEIQAFDETEYAMICFSLKVLPFPVLIERS